MHQEFTVSKTSFDVKDPNELSTQNRGKRKKKYIIAKPILFSVHQQSKIIVNNCLQTYIFH